MRSGMWVLPFLLVFAVGCYRDTPPDSPETVITLLSTLVHSPDVDIRRTTVMSLGKIGHPLAAGPLLAGLEDTDAQVRAYSAWGLGELGEQASERVEGPLVKLLRDSL